MLPSVGPKPQPVDSRWQLGDAPSPAVGTAEGFDAVEFAWADRDAATAYLAEWVRSRKVTERLNDLKVSSFFKDQREKWTRDLIQWRRSSREHQAMFFLTPS